MNITVGFLLVAKEETIRINCKGFRPSRCAAHIWTPSSVGLKHMPQLFVVVARLASDDGEILSRNFSITTNLIQ